VEGGATEVVATATVLAILITKVVDLIRNVVGDFLGGVLPKATWNLAALGLGVAVAVAWRINILDNYSDPTSVVQGYFGQVLTGLVIGGVSSGYHELFDALSGAAKRAKFGGQTQDYERPRDLP
jgi:hypothetical protein